MLTNFDSLRSIEWLETNGLGGYASGTVSGAHTRRYHGMLVAAMQPPVGRVVAISKVEETVMFGSDRYELSSNQYPGVVHPQGFQYLTRFDRKYFPEFYFRIGSIDIKKTIAAIHGENTTVIAYEVLNAPANFLLELRAFYACRDFHGLARANDYIGAQYLFDNSVFRTLNYQGCPEIFIQVPEASFTESRAWYYHYQYAAEQERGLDFTEDLYTHGSFAVELEKGSKLFVTLSLNNPEGRNGAALFQAEQQRRKGVALPFAGNDYLEQLVLAADQFVVKRGDLKSIVAGYPWFSDWGRDTMIALPGLCLSTGRFEDAKNILKAFAGNISQGMIPNRFPDGNERPEYNTIDATLWFFNAVYKYHQATLDLDFVKSVLPALRDIIDWHERGTRYGIKVDASDGLLSGGEEGVQLTWMDAKVGDWVVTPRRGKTIEVNALWFNALNVMSELLEKTSNVAEAAGYKLQAKKVKASIVEKFWNENDQCLYDYVHGDDPNRDIRPNQVYAISLPFQALDAKRAMKVLETIREHLLTPRGLRSLSPHHSDYKPFYGGGVWERDGAYHQGTVWSFLIGAYVDALVSLKGESGRREAAEWLSNFYLHLNEGCIGTVSEIFDGEPPHLPKGCFAQAWGVGEILRIALQYDLMPKSAPLKKSRHKPISKGKEG